MSTRPQYFAPLSIAAYLTWLAVAVEPLMRLLHGSGPALLHLLPGIAGLCAVLLLFVLREASRDRRRQQLLTILQMPAGLLVAAVFGNAVLLIPIAAQAAALFATRRLLLLLALTNGLLLLLLLAAGPPAEAITTALSYIGFQAFAVIVVRAMVEAQRARDAAQRITAELLATRALLAEGARAEERLHLSRELHDVAGHKLTALKLQLGLCATGGGDGAAALEACRQLADELLADVRGVVGTLRAHDGVDLHAALQALASGIPHPAPVLTLAEDARPADFARAQALLRVAQEGVTNALRHASASRLQISLRRDEGTLCLSVEDDGRGPGSSAAGHGLTGLAERLAAVGGTLQFGAGATGGSRLVARVPA